MPTRSERESISSGKATLVSGPLFDKQIIHPMCKAARTRTPVSATFRGTRCRGCERTTRQGSRLEVFS
jgi:hypothetical protein